MLIKDGRPASSVPKDNLLREFLAFLLHQVFNCCHTFGSVNGVKKDAVSSKTLNDDLRRLWSG